MAARTRKVRHDENTRAKIQASQLVNRLQSHVLGKVDLSPTQVQAATILLKKVMPDLTSQALTGPDGSGPAQHNLTVEFVTRSNS